MGGFSGLLKVESAVANVDYTPIHPPAGASVPKRYIFTDAKGVRRPIERLKSVELPSLRTRLFVAVVYENNGFIKVELPGISK